MSDIELRWLIDSGQEKRLQYRSKTYVVEYSTQTQKERKVVVWSDWIDVPHFFEIENLI